ncbi:MAG: hypothetical protein ABII00_17485 [Elusimicrobiota bacterium]
MGCARSAHTFHLSGSITASPRIQKRTERPNTVLFIVATNNGGVPVAVARIINPKLPLHYRMGEEDLVLPGGARREPLTVTVYVNTHGKVGVARRGDLRGVHRGTVHAGDRHVNIVIDEAV